MDVPTKITPSYFHEITEDTSVFTLIEGAELSYINEQLTIPSLRNFFTAKRIAAKTMLRYVPANRRPLFLVIPGLFYKQVVDKILSRHRLRNEFSAEAAFEADLEFLRKHQLTNNFSEKEREGLLHAIYALNDKTFYMWT